MIDYKPEATAIITSFRERHQSICTTRLTLAGDKSVLFACWSRSIDADLSAQHEHTLPGVTMRAVFMVVGIGWALMQVQRSPYVTYAGVVSRNRCRLVTSTT